VQRDSRLPDGVRWLTGHGPRIGETVRWRRGPGYREFRNQYAVGIPYVRVRQPVPSSPFELPTGFRTGCRGKIRTIITITMNDKQMFSPVAPLRLFQSNR
jgi:hypothetical protein